MAPRRSEKKPPPTQTAATTAPKPSRGAWKNEEQRDYMLSHWTDYVTHQNAKTLDRFWPRVYDGWYRQWPITPSLESIGKHGSKENAILVFRTDNNSKIRNWFHNHGRPGSKSTKSDLRLNQSEKRKLAPVQAYCAYAWESGLRELVAQRWEEQKLTYVPTDDDDPATDSIEPSGCSHIPINFKLKIAREAYNSLSQEERQKIDHRREEEWKKMYRSIPEIKGVKERDEKLLEHRNNQSSVAKSVVRALKNLADQAGCVSHIFVGYVDPQSGQTTFQNSCEGKTDSGLEFDDWYGNEWENLVEQRFKDWALTIFGEKDSSRRSMFMLSKPSSDKGKARVASHSQTSHAAAMEELTECLPEAGTTTVSEGGIAGESSSTPLPHIPGAEGVAPPYALIPPFLVDKPFAMTLQSPDDGPGVSVPPQVFETPRFVTPQEIFSPLQFLEPANAPLMATESPSSQISTPSQAAISPVVHDPASLTTPVLESSQAGIPIHAENPAITHESPHLATPIFESSQMASPNRTAHSNLAAPSPVLGSTQAATSCQLVNAPIRESTLINSTAAGSSPQVVPQQVVSQEPIPLHQVANPPHVILPQPAVTSGSSHPMGDVTRGKSGATVKTKGTYRSRNKASAKTANRARRESIEEAPDIILSLGGSGYELADPASHQEPPTTLADSNTDIFVTPSSTPPLDGLIVPSSRQSTEEYLTIPTEAMTADQTPPPRDNAMVSPSQQSAEEPLAVSLAPKTATAASGCFTFALRVIPDYNIDRSDLPSWLFERGRLNYILSVEAGKIWEKLITTWLRQERRLAFGLNEKLGTNLAQKEKPGILKDYFKWHHNPAKGNSVSLPEFGDEVSFWWGNIQPEWRYREECFPDVPKDYSYILAGGKKGVFLLILCLAWWDNAHGRDMEKEKAKRREAARAAGMDEGAIDFGDLRDHECKWFNIVNDLIFVMELAQAWPVPGENTSGGVGVVSARRKRGDGQGESSPPRKKKKSS